MARFAYFADLPNGETLEWRDTVVRGEVKAARGIDYRSHRDIRGYDAKSGQWVQVTRKIEMKSAPSLHECDDRCMYATGRIMRCECSCGGANHGKGGGFRCEAA